MSELDERLDLTRMRDLRGRDAHPWTRRVLLALLAVPVVLAASGAFGQQTSTLRAGTGAASLEVDVPDTVRGGLLWRARIAARAERGIEHPRIVLGSGWIESMQLNTLEPAPESEAARGPRTVLSYPAMEAGDELVVYLQLQTNPTAFGAQDTSVELDDEAQPLARIGHTTRVMP